jgi:hypothetical protein
VPGCYSAPVYTVFLERVDARLITERKKLPKKNSTYDGSKRALHTRQYPISKYSFNMGIVEVILEQLSFKGLLVFVTVSFTLWSILSKIDEKRRLARLAGAPAPKLNYWMPFGK